MVVAESSPNVYDEKGTVLYRVIPYSATASNKNSDDAANSKAGEEEGNMEISSTANFNTSFGAGSSTVSRGKTLRVNITSPPAAPRVRSLFSASVRADSPRPPQSKGMCEETLAMLFPPEIIVQEDKTSAGAVAPTAPSPPLSAQKTWVKVAAIDHTSRLDCVHLRDHLERRCREENARPSGVVCKSREGIYTDGLQEVIRQITVLCPERGVLLAELAAEMQQTTETYDILFDSACQYAVRKAIERDMRSYLFDDKERMASEVRRLENRVHELQAKHDGMLKRFEEQKQTEVKRHEEEVKYLKKANQQIITEIKRITALEKAVTSMKTTT